MSAESVAVSKLHIGLVAGEERKIFVFGRLCFLQEWDFLRSSRKEI